jgi:tyrosine-protein kinase Etk/Wzc
MVFRFDLAFLTQRSALRRIAAVAAAFAVVGAAYAFLAPRWYRSTLTVVPLKQQRGPAALSSLLGGDLGSLAAGLDVGGGSADVNRIAAVLESNSVTDAVIEKFDLRRRYGEKYQEYTRKELWEHCSVTTLPKPNLVQLTCEDKDAAFAQQLLMFFAEHGNAVFRTVSASSASEEVRFLEKRAAEMRHQAETSAARMRDFQERNRIVDLDSQAKAVVAALAGIQGERISKEVELGYAREFTAPGESTTLQIQSQLGVLQRKLSDLGGTPTATTSGAAQREKTVAGASATLFPAALAVPRLREEFETLLRDRKVSEGLLVLALERLEMARANEAREASTFLVLDSPTLPDRPARPKRLAVIALALVLGVIASVALEWFRAGGLDALTGVERKRP